MLTIENLTYRIAGRLILEDASATIQPGWKVGVVGPNGAGKSTLFKLIMGELEADGGKVHLADRTSVGWVRQDMPDNALTLLDVVLAADTERTQLMHAVETEQDPNKLGDVYDRLMEIDAYAAPARASIILAGLGFKEEQLGLPMSEFSGGWRMRVALAAALFQSPDVLLLDEPTNHLDLEAIMWLESYLANYPKTLLIISHDRDILNLCIDHVVHVENRKLTAYTGNYDTFERERSARLMSQQKLHEKQTAQRAKMQAFIDRFKAKASKATQAQSRMKALEKMSVVDAVMADRTIKFQFPQPDELVSPIIRIDEADIGYTTGKPILKRVQERIHMDDRIALLGANGNGKSTFIKLLASKLVPLKGEMVKAPKLRIGYFSQHQEEELDLSESAYQALARVMKGKIESQVRAVLGKFGFNKVLSDNPISSLSGGEKARLLFALMSHDAPHLLLLDEPTNHLDMDTRESLVEALNAYEGAVVIVSHDPSMVERVADSLWLVADGNVKPFHGDLDAYRTHIVEQRRQERRADRQAKKNVVEETPAEMPAKPALTAKELSAKRKRHPFLAESLLEAEKAMGKLAREKAKVEDAMADTDFYGDEKQVQKTQKTYAILKKDLELAENTWLEAQEAFDAAE
ncbi:MAG: ABC-F family ATP-binding cassette domain-containing protein [Alphaproteobacteria bacterium]